MLHMRFIQLLMACLMFFIPGASASNFDAGDALALVIGLLLGILGTCACLGCYARRRSAVQY